MDPITLLVYLLVAVIVIGIIYYAMVWLAVPLLPARIIILVIALLVLIWMAQKMGVRIGEIDSWKVAQHLKLLHI